MDNNNLEEIPDSELDSMLEVLEDVAQMSLLDYIPHSKQLEFHSAPNKIRFMCGGNRSGKTESGVWEGVAHATGDYPDWYPQEKRLLGANRGRVVVTDFQKGASVYEEKLWKYLPKDRVKSIKRTMRGALEKIEVKHKSGGISVIEMLTHEQDDMVFESWSGHWAHFDEPPPRNKFIATLRGLIDFKGRVWLTLTPLTEPWLYDEFISKADETIFYVHVDIRDNPHMDEAEIKDFESRLTEDEKEARIHGKFRHLVGRVYKEFDPAIHLLDQRPEDLFGKDWKHYPVYFVLDPHDRRPHCGIWAKVDPFGTIYVFAEIEHKATVKDLSKEILKREILMGIKSSEVHRILDPNKGRTPTAVTGLRLVDDFAKHAVYFTTSVNDDIIMGHLAVAEKLMWDKRYPLDMTNKPKLFFFREGTKSTVRMIQSYVWDDWKGSEKDKKERPKDVNKDFPDCVRYLVMSNPFFHTVDSEGDPTGEQPVFYGKGGGRNFRF